MIQTVEQIIESIRALPLSEKEKFFDLAEDEKQKILSEKKVKALELREGNKNFRRSLKWIEEHKEEFDGQWVVLDGNRLISHGKDAKTVYDQARAKGIETPFLERVKAKILPWGGW